jgi:hypothetical protein
MLFLAILAAALGFRLILTLLFHDGMLGVDGGAYLLGVAAVLGDEPTGAGFPRPPLAPGWLLVPFVSFLGEEVGYKVWSALASLAPALPVYLLARRIESSSRFSSTLSPALFAAGFVLLDLLYSEMLVTGALPMIGFGLLGMVWWAMGELTERWSWRNAAILAACLGLIPWINQTTAGLAIVTIPVYAVALAWCYKDHHVMITWWERVRRLIFPMLVGGLIALGALPWYMNVLPVTGVLNYPGAFIYLTHIYDSAWFQLLLAWPLGVWMIRKAEQPWLKSLGVLVVVLGTLTIFMSTDETIINIFYRSRYLLAIPVYVGFAWLIWRVVLPKVPPSLTKPLIGVSVAVVAILVVGFISQFNRQAGYSDMATPSTIKALDLLRRDAPGQGVINNSFTLSLWIAALNKVQSPHTWTWEPPPTWTATDKDVRCILGWVVGCDHIEAMTRLDVGYVLIDTRFPDYNARANDIYLAPPDPWGATAQTPWLTLVFEEDTTKVWRIDG